MQLRFALFFLFLGGVLSAQTLTLTDKNTKDVLEMATLVSQKPYAYTTTNAKGQTNVSIFKKAEKVEISILGYATLITNYGEMEKNNFKIALEPISLHMDELIISATKWTQKSDDVPSKIVSIGLKEVLFQNPQTTADLLGKTGNVFIQKSQQGGGSPMIRGFATNRLLYAVDGIRMNTAIFRGGNIQNVISLDAFSIENTEVLFGPGSVIYGSDAIGGVMSFQTHTPQLSADKEIITSGSALLRYATANQENTAHFHLNYGGEKWAGVSNFSFNIFDDLKMGSHGPEEYLRPYYVVRENGVDVIKENKDSKVQVPSGYNQYNLMQKIRFQPNKKFNFNYGFHYSTTSEYSRYDYHLRTKNNAPRYGEWSYGPQKWMMNLLSVDFMSHELVYDYINLKVAHQYFEESRISRDLNKTKRQIRLEKVNAYSVNLDFQKGYGDNNHLNYGLEYVLDDVNSTGIDENINTGEKVDGAARYPLSQWSSMAAYITNQYHFSNKLNVQSGLRYNLYKIDAEFDTTFYPFPFTETHTNNGALTGSIGLVYKPTSKFEVSLNTATAFRAPNIDDMGKVFDSTPGSVVVPNPDLEAEYAYSADLGLAKLFSNNLKINVNGYYTYLDKALVRRPFTLDGATQIMYDGELSDVYAIQNAAYARVYGVQGGVELKLKNGMGFESNVNWQKGVEVLDNGEENPSRHAAPLFGNALVNYKKNKFNFEFNAIYTAEKSYNQLPAEEKEKGYMYAKDSEGHPYSPSWYTLNFKGSYELTKSVNLTLGVENITDQRYRPYSSGISGAGRNFIVAVRTNF